MADLGVICVSQPLMVHNYGDWLLDQYGDFARDVMPLRREIEAGITVALSADNVLPLDPLKVIQRAAERTCKSGRPIGPEQALTIEEGLRAYTADSALTIGLENELGTIEPGKLADLVILEKDPVMQPISEVGSIETVMTIVGGEIVWESAKSKVSKLLPSG
jgi:predicted amidohydrolase YtcJ